MGLTGDHETVKRNRKEYNARSDIHLLAIEKNIKRLKKCGVVGQHTGLQIKVPLPLCLLKCKLKCREYRLPRNSNKPIQTPKFSRLSALASTSFFCRLNKNKNTTLLTDSIQEQYLFRLMNMFLLFNYFHAKYALLNLVSTYLHVSFLLSI